MDLISTTRISKVKQNYNQEDFDENDEIFNTALLHFDFQQSLRPRENSVVKSNEKTIIKQTNDINLGENIALSAETIENQEIMSQLDQNLSDDDSIPTTSKRTKRKFVLESSDDEDDDVETEEDKLFIDDTEVSLQICPNLPESTFKNSSKKSKIDEPTDEIQAELQYLRSKLEDKKYEERMTKLELDVAKHGRLLRALQAQVRALRRNKSDD